MAFGRSNSLSINTGAANSPFGQQNTSQPTTSGGLFGTATSKPGGIFGNTSTQPAATTNTSTGGLFGSNAQQSQPQQSGGLFGGSLGQNTQNQNQTQTQTPTGTTGGGLFGQSQSQPTQTSSLFGGLSQNQNQNQQQKPAGSVFGGFGSQHTSQPAQGSSLFGGLGQNKPAGNSFFGGSTTQQSQQQPQQQQQQQPSLLAASMFNNGNATHLGGSLTMGQGNTSSTQPGVKIDLSNIRPTTRFSDLHDDIKSKIEEIDKFIRQQESYASQCEALLPSHSNSISTLPPDIGIIESKAETVELGLENDSRHISAAKETLKTDVKDLTRVVRVIENQSLPSRFHYGPSSGSGVTTTLPADADDYDVDLPAYFSRHAESMGATRETFAANLAEIEAHLSVVERRTAAMIGEVGRDRASGPARAGDDTVRELADPLRGFEGGILDAARKVGGAREGVEDLIAGRRR